MSFRIPLARPCTGPEEIEAAAAVIRSGRLVRGPRVEAFERAVAGWAGVEHAVAFSSGTTALLAALKCLGVGPGDEVVVPALTFPAPAAAVVWAGATPVFADVDARSLVVDPADAATRTTKRTRVVIAVDQFGMPAPAVEMEKVAKRRGAFLLVDAACSLGSSLEGRPAGSFGEAAVLSFHPRKVVTTGEGGMVLTGHEGMARTLEAIRNHGIDGEGRFSSPGMNFRMGEVQGAIGEAQMARLGRMVARRREIAAIYARLLPESVAMQEAVAGAETNWQTLAAVLPESAGEAGRDGLVGMLGERGIEATVASYCVPALPAYEGYARDPMDYPNAMRAARLGVALPMHDGMTDADAGEVARAVGEAMDAIGKGR